MTTNIVVYGEHGTRYICTTMSDDEVYGVIMQAHPCIKAGSATPVAVSGTLEAHFDPDYPNPTPCPECSGRGSIELFTSTVPCKCCGGG